MAENRDSPPTNPDYQTFFSRLAGDQSETSGFLSSYGTPLIAVRHPSEKSMVRYTRPMIYEIFDRHQAIMNFTVLSLTIRLINKNVQYKRLNVRYFRFWQHSSLMTHEISSDHLNSSYKVLFYV